MADGRKESLSPDLHGSVKAVYVRANFLLNYTHVSETLGWGYFPLPDSKGYSPDNTDKDTWLLFTCLDSHTQSWIPFLHNTIII